MRDVMRQQGWSLRTIARNWGMTPAWACQIMKLTRLAPEIQEKILALTTTTPGVYLTERKLRTFVCSERDPDRQREMFEKLLAGELRLPGTGERKRRRHTWHSAARADPMLSAGRAPLPRPQSERDILLERLDRP